VIISTAITDRGDAVLRVRDTGAGMTDKEIETAMEPFRQLATSTRWGSGGTGLGLPLTKALAEANRASFTIKSAVDTGTLVEIAFPGTRVAAE
jgi:signal transduction histidine kinase